MSPFKLQVSGTSNINASRYQIAFSTNQTGNWERTTREIPLSWILNITLLLSNRGLKVATHLPCSFHLLNLRTSSRINGRNIAQGTTHPRLECFTKVTALKAYYKLIRIQLQDLINQTSASKLGQISVSKS